MKFLDKILLPLKIIVLLLGFLAWIFYYINIYLSIGSMTAIILIVISYFLMVRYLKEVKTE